MLLRLFRLSNKVSTLYSGMARWRDAAISWMRVTVVQMLDGSFSAPATSHLSLRGARFIRSVISVSVNSVEASLTMASGHFCWMILLLLSLAPTIAYAPGFTVSLANACRTPPGVVPTSIKSISSPRKLWPSCHAAKASKPLGSRDEVRQTPSPVADASLATTKGLVRKRRSKSISGRWHKAERRSSSTPIGTMIALPRETLPCEWSQSQQWTNKLLTSFLPTASKNFRRVASLGRVPGEPCSEPDQAADDRARRRDHSVAINSTPLGLQL